MPTAPYRDGAAASPNPPPAGATAAFLLCALAGRIATTGLPIGLVVQAAATSQPAASAANGVALYTAVAALTGPLIGRVNDRGGSVLARYRAGLSLFAVTAFYLSRQPDVSRTGPMFAAAVAGLALPLSGSAWSGAATRVLPPPVNRRLRSYDVGTYAAAALAAPLAIGALAPLLSRYLPLVTCGGFAIAAAISSAVLRSDAGSVRTGAGTRAPLRRWRREKWRTLQAHWPFMALLLVTMGIQPIAIALTLNAPFFSTMMFGSRGAAGLVLATLSLGTLISSLNAHRPFLQRVSTPVLWIVVVASALGLPELRPGWLGAGCLLLIGLGNGLLLVATLARVDAMFSGRIRSRIFAVAETSRMMAGSAASWALGAINLSPRASVTLSIVPLACLLPLLLAHKPRGGAYQAPPPPTPLEGLWTVRPR